MEKSLNLVVFHLLSESTPRDLLVGVGEIQIRKYRNFALLL
jgi:hypothetical protein